LCARQLSAVNQRHRISQTITLTRKGVFLHRFTRGTNIEGTVISSLGALRGHERVAGGLP
jgi:hypothetical protein